MRHGTGLRGRRRGDAPAVSPQLTPASDGRLEIRVEALNATRVVARFVTAGQPLEVPLTAAGAGVFVATTAPPAGWTSVAFIAEDDAGNRNSIIVAASRDVPGVGVALALAVIGLVAFAARRRATR